MTNKQPRIIVYPYKMGSESAKKLAAEVGGARVYPDRKYRPRESDVIINWGSSRTPDWATQAEHIYNRPSSVNLARNKILTLSTLDRYEVPTLNWTTNRSVASHFEQVVVRNDANGCGGAGIELHNADDGLPYAPLYTQYIESRGEVRVHVFNDVVIDYTEKRRKKEFEGNRNERVRNHSNGWVFCREDVDEREDVMEVARRAVSALGLDFGAVDIIIDEDNNPRVLEVNTACGLEGTTLEKYKSAINGIAFNKIWG